MGMRRLIVDRWGPLNFKRAFSGPADQRPDRTAFPDALRGWVPEEDRRRLAAYTLLSAYGHNQAWQLAEISDGTDASARREFGDVAMLVDTIASNILGREQTITVPGAEHANTPDGTNPDPEAAHAAHVQDQLRKWAKDELFALRIQQNERKVVREGDGIYLTGLDTPRTGTKRRPRLQVIDPGFYFPDLPDNDGDSADYPTRVHLAWEVPADPKIPGSRTRLRRITYELAPIGTATVSATSDTDQRPFRAAALADDGITPILTPGDTFSPDTGQITRLYPWNSEPSPWTVYLTDAEWFLEDIKADQDIHSLDERYATYLVREDGEVLDHLDCGIDFLPVVHLPNTIPEDGHWGTSSLANLLQLLDEIQGTDTDSSEASALTGSPIIGIVNPKDNGGRRGDTKRNLHLSPGTAIELQQGGGLITVDTASNLAELRHKSEELQDRLTVVSRTPGVTLGTVDPTQAPSGFAIQLAYSPHDSLIGSMRLARDHKYTLLLKFIQRFGMLSGDPDWAGPVVDAGLAWGSYMPTDRAATLTDVSTAYNAGLLSLETATRMLQEAGFPIDDIAEEIQRIQSRRFADAVALANATNSTEAVSAYLGIKINPDPEPPTPVLPPTPGQDPEQDPETQPPA